MFPVKRTIYIKMQGQLNLNISICNKLRSVLYKLISVNAAALYFYIYIYIYIIEV